MNIKDKFIQEYIPDNRIWQELISTGLSPNSHNQSEAIKRMIALIILNSQAVESPLKCKAKAKEIMSMETWFWAAEKAEEALSIPLDRPCGERVSLHENVGIGFHLFKRTDNRGKQIPDLYADTKDGSGAVLPMAIIIEKQSVKCFAVHEDGTCGIFIIPQDSELFLTAAKMSCFLNQKLVNVEKVTAAPRHIRKRWGMDAPESKTEINVVTWRKVKYESNESGTKKEWDKHWYVRGHVRWQPYPSEGVSKPIWIDTHVRGNIDAPLHNKDRINAVTK